MEFVKQYHGISIFSYFFINHQHCPHFSFLELFSFYDFKTEEVGVSVFIFLRVYMMLGVVLWRRGGFIKFYDSACAESVQQYLDEWRAQTSLDKSTDTVVEALAGYRDA